VVVHHCNQPHHTFHLHEEHRYLLKILLLVEVHKLLVVTVGPLAHGSKEVDTCLKEVEEHCVSLQLWSMLGPMTKGWHMPCKQGRSLFFN
jgi:hypothetical protein